LGLAQKYNFPLNQQHIVGHNEIQDCFYPGNGHAGCYTGSGPDWNRVMAPITPGLISTMRFSIVTYTGTVKLQARTNHSGTALSLVDGPCVSLDSLATITTTPVATTTKTGRFTVTLIEAEGEERCLLARHPNYLPTQRVLPTDSDLGLVVLSAGDMNQNGRINILDLSLLSKRYNKRDSKSDLTGDGRIDLIDLILAAYNFNRKGPVEWPVPGLGSGSFMWPASGDISNGFYRYHPALDIAAYFGAPILAADSGRVVEAGWDTYYGYHLIIDHGNGYQTLYAHLQRYYVDVGSNVLKGTQIGEMGSTGNSSGPHLHFEIRQENVERNPYNFLP
jgi:hypothetical protein